jgi:uncharacterized protein
MYKTIVAMTGMLLCVAAAHADEIQLPHVTVYGTATTEVTPDQMVWSLSVKNKGLVLTEVAQKHTQIVADLLQFLKQASIPEDTIQTARMEFGENYEDRNHERVQEGFRASTDVSFKCSDLGKYRDLWIGLAAIDGVTVDDVSYEHSKRIDYQNETRIKALLTAKEKAVALAKALGAEIGEPLFIEEDPSAGSDWRPSTINCFQGPAGDDRKVVALGKIEIWTTVRVVFRLITVGK